jgi:hypothetical protein
MFPDKVASLMQELERVLEDGRPVNDVAPLGSGLRMVKVVPGGTERVAASPTAQRVHDLVTQILSHCPGSKGLKRYVAGMVEVSFRFQLGTEWILAPLRDPELYDPQKIKAHEVRCWHVAVPAVLNGRASLEALEELYQWENSFRDHYGSLRN